MEEAWNDAYSERALKIWEAYKQEHDVSAHSGQAVGIDPVTEEVWFGASAQDIERERAAAGIASPFYCLRVGSDFYLRKGPRK
jgi:hypothetical protein